MQISSYSAASAMQQLQQTLMKKADADKDGSLTLDEFSAAGTAKNAGRSTSADQTTAAKLFQSIDADGDGKASESELGSFFSKMSSDTRTSLLSTQESGGGMSGLMAKADEDGNGALSLDEFSAAAPRGASTGKSAEIFGEMDADGSGEVSEDELSAFNETHRPPPPGGGQGSGGPGGASGSGSSLADMLAEASDSDESDTVTSLSDILSQISSADDESKTGDASSDFSKQLSSLLQQMVTSYAGQTKSGTSSMSLSA